MSRLQNASIKGRSEFKITEAEAFAPKYVVTTAHSIAVEKLETLRTIIITGEPGIGKSTLAEQVALQYVLKGFEVCCIADSPNEAEAVWQKDTRQLFYFDDFLGRNYFVALEQHQDSHIVGLIKRIRNDASKRFILTSRTTVLNRGKSLTDLFRIENLARNEYELTVDHLTLVDKAHILYNHLWHSELNKKYIDELYVEKRYLKVVQHRNYNPRLISFITDAYKVEGIAVNEYWSYIQKTLNNPSEIWSHVFDNQLNASAQLLVRLLVFNGRDILEEDLRDAYFKYVRLNVIAVRQADEFELTVRLAVGSVINRIVSSSGNSITYSLFNPSLGDYIIHRYKENNVEISACLVALQTYTSLRNLFALGLSKKCDAANYTKVLSVLSNGLLNDEQVNFRYRVELGSLISTDADENNDFSPEFIKFSKWLFTVTNYSTNSGSQAQVLLSGVRSLHLAKDDSNWPAKIRSLMSTDTSQDDFEYISELVSELSTDLSEELSEQIITSYVKLWKKDIEQTVSEGGLLDDFTMRSQSEKAKDKLRNFVRDKAGQLFIELPDEAISEIIDSCDVYAIIDANEQRDREDGGWPSPSAGYHYERKTDELTTIIDLFDVHNNEVFIPYLRQKCHNSADSKVDDS